MKKAYLGIDSHKDNNLVAVAWVHQARQKTPTQKRPPRVYPVGESGPLKG